MTPPPFYLSSGRDGSVLVVDDVERNLQVVGELLAKQRYEVFFASNGPAALERVAAKAPDLILLDLMMPGMDGIEVCRRLQCNPATQGIPIIFLTADQETETGVKALSEGAVDYITKPFHAPELLARVATHIALKRTRDEMHKIVAEKSELMAAVAHDLKNPISSVRFAAHTLRDDGIGPEDPRRELVDTIVDTCNEMLALIEDRLMRRAREVQLIRLDAQPIDLAEVLRVVVQQNRSAAHAKSIPLDLVLPKGKELTVIGDYHAIAEVFDNLISNAIKFSPPGAPVNVRLGNPPSDAFVRIEVRDHGPGCSKEDREKLFKPYTRLSARPTGGESSTGLGLSISKGLVDKMGGDINCDSPADGGASFWVDLPHLSDSD